MSVHFNTFRYFMLMLRTCSRKIGSENEQYNAIFMFMLITSMEWGYKNIKKQKKIFGVDIVFLDKV